jgi:hypothetical protein
MQMRGAVRALPVLPIWPSTVPTCTRSLPGWHDAVLFPVNLSVPGTKNATSQRRKRLRLETDKLQCLTSPRCVPYIKAMSSSLHLFTSLPLAGALSLATLLAARA